MKHYEIVIIVHPDQSNQVADMIERYKNLITSKGGNIHRVEDWGRRTLAYPIQKLTKAHYILLNVECNHELLHELETGFTFNDAVMRHLIVKKREAESEPSIMLQKKQEEKQEDLSIESEQDEPSTDNITAIDGIDTIEKESSIEDSISDVDSTTKDIDEKNEDIIEVVDSSAEVSAPTESEAENANSETSEVEIDKDN